MERWHTMQLCVNTDIENQEMNPPAESLGAQPKSEHLAKYFGSLFEK